MLRTIAALLFLVSLVPAGEADRLQEDIAALRFLNRLQLSREQALAVLPIAERGAFYRREFDRERDFLYTKFYDALVSFRAEDVRNEGLSAAVMAAAGGIDHAIKLMGNAVASALGPLERQASNFLDARQRSIAFPRAQDRHPLDLLRTMRGSDFREVRDRLARALATARAKAGVIDRWDRRSERLRIERVLHNIRSWSDEEYAARREKLLTELVPGRERAKIVAEIRRIYAARYGRAGPLANFLFHERMLPVLAERAGVPPVTLPPVKGTGRTLPGNMDDVKREIAELRADINLLNLMNGLHLEPKQLKTILRAAGECKRVRPARVKRDEEKKLAALRAVYAALRKGEPAPASALSRLQDPLAKRGAGYLAARRRDYAEACESGVDRLLDVLTPSQGEVIRTYSPCLVPPKDLRDPVRAGQANDNGPLESLLDGLRRTHWTGDGRAQADAILKRIEAHEGILPDKQREKALGLIVSLGRQAAALDEVGYAARRSELAARLEPVRRLHTLKERLEQIEGAAAVVKSKIATMLLDPRIIPLARERLARLEHPEKRVRPDIPKAETCEPGKCGSR